MKKSAKVWQFVQHKTGSAESWTWRCLFADGATGEISQPHASFGKAVTDALARGFQPRKQHWTTKSGNWITHFAPGKGPYSVLAGSTAPAPGRQIAAPLRKKAARNRITRGAGNAVLKKSQRAKSLARNSNYPAPARKPSPKRPG
jgi:hypothetical protein